MKKITLLLLMFGIFSVSAQTTHNILWGFNSNPGAAGDLNSSRTIEVGDTVIWTWDSTGSHNVVSQVGSAESFNSGSPTGAPNTFSVTFTVEGTNDYVCNPHSGFMLGTITVAPVLSVDENIILSKFKISPNPVSSEFSIELPDNVGSAKVQLFDILGKQLISGEISELKSVINVSGLNNGIYLVKVSSDNSASTKRIIKQ